MASFRHTFALTTSVFYVFATVSLACSNGECQVGEACSSDEDCAGGLLCFSCELAAAKCVRTTFTNQFKILNNSMAFNKYAFSATHNSFAIDGEPFRLTNQEDNITQQLNNGVRALLLDTYDFEGTVWLCHSFGGECRDFTKFNPAIDTFKEISKFLSANPSEIVTLILEDYVKSPNGLTKVFTDSGLKQFWFPVEKMPRDGRDWPLVKDMVKNNQRLIVFTSVKSKQETEGIAYQWNYMVENQYGNDGEKPEECSNRVESTPLADKTKSLVFVNHFGSIAVKGLACADNSEDLLDMIQTCYVAAGNRWANFVAVDYYKRSKGGGAFQAVDKLNGELLCGRDDVHDCMSG